MEQLIAKFGFFVCYGNRYGVKTLNIPNNVGKKTGKKTNVEVQKLDPRTLLLPYDCLKDKYTQLGTDILHSPHYALMQGCAAGDLTGNPYVERAEKGTLDERDSYLFADAAYIKSFRDNLESFEEESTKTIFYYEIGGKRYIADGKHRAALAAFLGKPVYGVLLRIPWDKSKINMRRLKIMKRHPKAYSKNIAHLEQVMGIRKPEGETSV